jgi:hypothetical protein
MNKEVEKIELHTIVKEGLEPYINAMVDYKKLCDEKDKETKEIMAKVKTLIIYFEVDHLGSTDTTYVYDKLLDYITSLEEKVEKLNKELDEATKIINIKHKAFIDTIQELTETATRIDKTIEYIEEYCIDDEFYVNLTKKEKNIIEAYNILKGEDNNGL